MNSLIQKNNQKGFASLILIGVLIILLGVGGYFAWNKKTTPVAVNETATTKTYVSDLGYSVDYPSDWVADHDGIKPAQPEMLAGMPAQYFEVRLENSSFGVIEQNNNRNVGGQNLVELKITFGGDKAFAYTDKYSKEFYEVLVEHNDKVYTVWTQNYNLNEVKMIFTSFKFTEPTKAYIPNLKTYTNSKYNFEFQYRSYHEPSLSYNSGYPGRLFYWDLSDPVFKDGDVGEPSSSISLSVWDNSKQLSLLDWATLNKSSSNYDPDNISDFKNEMLASHKAVSYLWTGVGYGRTVIIENNKRIFLFSIGADENASATVWGNFQKILSTFKFTK